MNSFVSTASRESSTRVDANPNILRACRNLRQALFTYLGSFGK